MKKGFQEDAFEEGSFQNKAPTIWPAIFPLRFPFRFIDFIKTPKIKLGTRRFFNISMETKRAFNIKLSTRKAFDITLETKGK